MRRPGKEPEEDFEDEEEEWEKSPFGVTLSKITKRIFSIQNPFVAIIDGSFSASIDTAEDKVRDGKCMDDIALKEAIHAMQWVSEYYRRVFKVPSSELGMLSHHVALASGFWFLTKPSPTKSFSSLREYVKAGQESEKPRPEEEENQEDLEMMWGQISEKPRPEEEEEEEEEEIQEDLEITHHQLLLTSGESKESLDVKQEGDEGEIGDEKIKYYFNFLVNDKKLKGFDTRVSTLIVDATWNDLSINKMCQVASYGCKWAIKNIEKGRFSPIYLELWGEDRWRYGILYMEGLVVIENGKVVANAYTSSPIERLQKTLESTRRLHKDAIGSHMYPDGTYVEGYLYLPSQKFGLPNTDLEHIADMQLFYQSKIRIIAGDKALGWTPKDVEDRVAVRMSSLKRREALEDDWVPLSKNKRLRKR